MKKVFALLLAFIMLLSLSACGGKDTVSAGTVVGTVDGEEIYYDELYFLVQSYIETLRERHGEDPAALAKALDELVKEDILSNVAILRLCQKRGLDYNPRDLRDLVDTELEAILQQSFGGDEEAYRADMAAHGLTERYLRYATGVDLLYGELMTVYPEQNLVRSAERELRHYIESHFYRVYHLVLFNDTEAEAEANYAKMTEARQQLLSGANTIYGLIKAGYTEDMMDPDGSGYYIHRGTMDKAYEEAAFSLKMAQVSPIVETTAENNSGKTVSCYYLIQRFALDEAYIDEHLEELRTEYYTAVIYGDLNEIRDTLSFTPNDFYRSLDLNALKAPHETSTALVITLSVLGGVLVVGAAVAVTVVLLKKKHGKKNIPQ